MTRIRLGRVPAKLTAHEVIAAWERAYEDLHPNPPESLTHKTLRGIGEVLLYALVAFSVIGAVSAFIYVIDRAFTLFPRGM